MCVGLFVGSTITAMTMVRDELSTYACPSLRSLIKLENSDKPLSIDELLFYPLLLFS